MPCAQRYAVTSLPSASADDATIPHPGQRAEPKLAAHQRLGYDVQRLLHLLHPVADEQGCR